jgi:Tfp pilus assembly protein PilF
MRRAGGCEDGRRRRLEHLANAPERRRRREGDRPAAEARHVERALAHHATGDAPAAARDLQQVLRLEPRHWQALQQLAQWQEEAGDPAGALRSIEAALAIHPRLRGGEARLRDLRRKALGDDA